MTFPLRRKGVGVAPSSSTEPNKVDKVNDEDSMTAPWGDTTQNPHGSQQTCSPRGHRCGDAPTSRAGTVLSDLRELGLKLMQAPLGLLGMLTDCACAIPIVLYAHFCEILRVVAVPGHGLYRARHVGHVNFTFGYGSMPQMKYLARLATLFMPS